VIEGTLALHEFLYRSNPGIFDATTQTAVGKLKKLFRFFALGGYIDRLGYSLVNEVYTDLGGN
jgi:hypothetical protein